MKNGIIYDITATISPTLPFFGNEGPTVRQLTYLDKGDDYNLTLLKMTAHTGTHADMPLHFIREGDSCEEIPLEHFYGLAKVFRINTCAHICKTDLEKLDIQPGDIILLDTGQSAYMQQVPLKQDFIALTPAAAEYLVEKKVRTIGIDYLSVDPYEAADFPAHKILLGNGVAILEGLVLSDVPEGTYTLSALPIKIEGSDGSPVRAILINTTR